MQAANISFAIIKLADLDPDLCGPVAEGLRILALGWRGMGLRQTGRVLVLAWASGRRNSEHKQTDRTFVFLFLSLG